MNNPLVSVLIPVYNEEKNIARALCSIGDQTYNNIEIIIIDDGSTDNTLSEIEPFKEMYKNITIISQKNRGITRALNLGLNYCNGEYIARLDASDQMMPDRIEKQVAFLESNLDHALVGSFREERWEDSDKVRKLKLPSSNQELQRAMVIGSSIPHATILARADLMKVYGYDESFKTSQDYDLWVRIAKTYKVANLPEYLIIAGNTSSSISRNKKKFHTLITQLRIRTKAYFYLDCPKWYFVYLAKPFIEFLLPKKLIQKIIDSK